MPQPLRGSAALIIVMVLAGVVVAINLGVLFLAMRSSTDLPLYEATYRLTPTTLALLVGVPLALAAVAGLIVQRLGGRTQQTATRAAPAKAAAPTPPSPAPALRLLALLQQEGRLVDFLQEDIQSYSDAQIGAAVRSIHAGCRKALAERVELQRIFNGEDGSEVVIEPGFDPAAVRLTGNVAGTPPFRGTLQHAGWRAAKVSLPQSPGNTDPTIIAPAEVEVT